MLRRKPENRLVPVNGAGQDGIGTGAAGCGTLPQPDASSGGAVRVMIAIPVYNHGRMLREVVCKAMAVHADVLVVDDGSTDGGAETLEGLAVRVVRHPFNLGKGAAIQTAADAARRLGMTHIITLDADGQHNPRDVTAFIRLIQVDPEAVIIGRRVFPATGVPGLTRFGRAFSNFWVRLQTGVAVGDSQSGFRAYPLAVLEGLRLREKGYAFEVEVLVKASWAGVRLRETAVQVHYPPARERISHFRVLSDNFKISLLNTRLTLRCLLPFPHRRLFASQDPRAGVSVLRPLRSLRLMLAEKATPSALAISGALGVGLGVLPFFFCHTLIILGVAGYFRLNKITALAASQLCMPPLVPALCIEAGHFLRHGRFLTEISLTTLGYQAVERLYEWVLGSLVLAPIMSVTVGALIYVLSIALQWTIHETAE
jgi:uncharacterized protein (DUF2062 family)